MQTRPPPAAAPTPPEARQNPVTVTTRLPWVPRLPKARLRYPPALLDSWSAPPACEPAMPAAAAASTTMNGMATMNGVAGTSAAPPGIPATEWERRFGVFSSVGLLMSVESPTLPSPPAPPASNAYPGWTSYAPPADNGQWEYDTPYPPADYPPADYRPVAHPAYPARSSWSDTAPLEATAATPTLPAARTATVGRAAASVGLLFVANRGLGLLRDVIIAGKFGTSPDLDAYYAAFRLPDFLFLVIASGAFGAAFIPVFVGFLERGEESDAWRLANSVLNTAVVALTALAGLGFLLAEPLMRYAIAPGLVEHPDQLALAVTLTRILLIQPILLGVGGAAMGILNAQQRFTVPALAPVTYNLGIVFGALALTPRFGIRGLAYGVLLGALGHVLTQLPSLLRLMRYMPIVSLKVPGMKRVGALLLPRMFGQAVFALNFVIVTDFASRLGEGRIAAFQFGYTLFLLPHGVFALSAATVLFPALSRLAEARDWEGFRERYAGTLRTVCFFMVPASAALVALRIAIPEAIFQLGAFGGKSTELTAVALGALSTGLIAYGVVEIVTRAFYALHDTRTPVIAGVVTIALNAPLSYALSRVFDLGGLALGLSLTTWLEMIILLVVFRTKVRNATPDLLSALVPVFWATAAMCAALAPCVWLLTRLHHDTGKSLPQLAFFLVTLGIGAAVYLGVATLLGVPEVTRVRDDVLRRLGRGA